MQGGKSKIKTYNLDKKALRRLYRRAYRAQKKDQSEICGALVADSSNTLELCFLKNWAERACRFEIDVDDLKRVRKEAKEIGKHFAGVFHSHPISEAVPSLGDLKEAKINSLMLIYDVCGCEARLWRILKDGNQKRTKEVTLNIVTNTLPVR